LTNWFFLTSWIKQQKTDLSQRRRRRRRRRRREGGRLLCRRRLWRQPSIFYCDFCRVLLLIIKSSASHKSKQAVLN
jgi:hypothetical protein